MTPCRFLVIMSHPVKRTLLSRQKKITTNQNLTFSNNNFKLYCVVSACVLPNPLQVKFSSLRQPFGRLNRTCPEGGAALTQQFNRLKADGKPTHVSRRWRKSNGNPAAEEPSGNIRHIKDDAPSSGSWGSLQHPWRQHGLPVKWLMDIQYFFSSLLPVMGN